MYICGFTSSAITHRRLMIFYETKYGVSLSYAYLQWTMIIYRQTCNSGFVETRWVLRNEHHREFVALGIVLDRLEHSFRYEWWTYLDLKLCWFSDNNQRHCQRILQATDVLRSWTFFKVCTHCPCSSTDTYYALKR